MLLFSFVWKCWRLRLSFALLLSLSSKDCQSLLAEMSMDIGKVNIYDIYDVCNMNLSLHHPSRAKYVNKLGCEEYELVRFQ